ncbi:MAG: serine hydrolase [Bdellovibrionales bacterium]|nr:serine hydrolase [Bdellovibrionales bacterium]
MRKNFIFTLILSLIVFTNSAFAYPLDGFDETGITRLEGYFHSLPTATSKEEIGTGAMLGLAEINLSLKNKPGVILHSQAFKQENFLKLLSSMNASGISASIIDFSDVNNASYISSNDNASFIPGSVGKIFVAASLFASLAELYPDSISKRREILKTKLISATDFVDGDTHDVPFWDLQNRKIYYRPLQIGDTANIWTYLDWMLSASSNAAASMVIREVILMNAFKNSYPVSTQEEENFLLNASSSELANLMRKSFIRRFFTTQSTQMYQASAFTKNAKKILPGVGSTATTRGLADFLWNLEKGKIVDNFSSLEIKRLLYSTQKRVRYAAAPILNESAVYFKSGSLYSCRPEAGFICGKYRGNKLNLLNSISLIESPAENPRYKYISIISSNILRKDSEELHRQLADEIHRFIQNMGGI